LSETYKWMPWHNVLRHVVLFSEYYFQNNTSKSSEQNVWEANSRLGSQENLRLLWNPKPFTGLHPGQAASSAHPHILPHLHTSITITVKVFRFHNQNSGCISRVTWVLTPSSSLAQCQRFGKKQLLHLQCWSEECQESDIFTVLQERSGQKDCPITAMR
jgi:hypothetical protein